MSLSENPNDVTYITNLVSARRAELTGLSPQSRTRMAGAARLYLEEEGESLLAAVHGRNSAGAVNALVKTLASATLSGPVTFCGVVFGGDAAAAAGNDNSEDHDQAV